MLRQEHAGTPLPVDLAGKHTDAATSLPCLRPSFAPSLPPSLIAFLSSPACVPPPFPGDRAGKYNGVLDCFVKTARNEGLLAFYNGFMPNFARLGSWNIAMFLMLEQVGSRGVGGDGGWG